MALLPGLAEHHCAAGGPAGCCEAMARGTYFGHVTEHVTLELSSTDRPGGASSAVRCGRGRRGRYDVILECPQDEPADPRSVERLITLAMRT